jgi:hypothetical protein
MEGRSSQKIGFLSFIYVVVVVAVAAALLGVKKIRISSRPDREKTARSARRLLLE